MATLKLGAIGAVLNPPWPFLSSSGGSLIRPSAKASMMVRTVSAQIATYTYLVAEFEAVMATSGNLRCLPQHKRLLPLAALSQSPSRFVG